MNFNQRVLKEIEDFTKETPEGLTILRTYVGQLEASKKFTGKEYLAMFDALVETMDVNAAWRLVQQRGIQCSKSPLDKVIMSVSRYITKYNWEHPYEVEVNLPEEMEEKVRECVNNLLREYGYELNDGRRKSYIISRINGERFENKYLRLEEQKKG